MAWLVDWRVDSAEGADVPRGQLEQHPDYSDDPNQGQQSSFTQPVRAQRRPDPAIHQRR
jgi:hypothetical protein